MLGDVGFDILGEVKRRNEERKRRKKFEKVTSRWFFDTECRKIEEIEIYRDFGCEIDVNVMEMFVCYK